MLIQDAIPNDWTSRLAGGPLGLGLDIATTDKKTSNPSALSVTEDCSPYFAARLMISWKTADPEVTKAIIDHVLDQIEAAKQRARRFCIDASNEVFYATTIKNHLAGRLPVELVKGGEKVTHKGEELTYKQLLGNLYINALDDGLYRLPTGGWIAYDHRLVKRDKGSFSTDLGKNGEHGDTFDGNKLAHWALVGGGGPVQASAASVGSFSKGRGDRPGRLRNRLTRQRRGHRINA